MHVKKNDQVLVIAGRDRGARGKVLRVLPGKGRAVVERVNMIKRHTRPNPQKGVKGGILEREAPLAVDNLMVVCPECGSGDVLASGTPEAESKIGGTVVGGRFSEIRQRFQMDWLRDGLNGTAGPLFKVENLTLGNMRFENTSGASMGFEIEVGKVLDSWKWDEATLRQMGLWDALQALRLAMLFVFMYYTWLHFWKEFNR